jgi:hypothetical protein
MMTSATKTTVKRSPLAIFEGILPIDPARTPLDVIVSATVAIQAGVDAS